MTFEPKSLPTLNIDHVVQGPKETSKAYAFRKSSLIHTDVIGSAQVRIVAVKPAGIIRPKKPQDHQEPYEGEYLLVESMWGVDPQLDIKPVDQQEPGMLKYYKVLLPKRNDPRKPGYTTMAKYHLSVAKTFDLLETALEDFHAGSD